MKKIVSLLLVLCTLLSLCCFASAAGFQDIGTEGTALYTAATALNERGIAKGVSETLYGTEKPVTREQMAAFIYRMLHDGKSLEGGENKTAFADLADPTFFAMVSWVNKEGIIKGQSETAFNPKGGITLQDACTMLTRALGCEKNGELSYPIGYVGAAEKKGLLANVEQKNELTRTLTRGDVAILMHNSMKAYDEDVASRHVLDGKRVLIMGNSHTYYGKTVLDKGTSVIDQESRSNDQGYFYQLCKRNGAEVSVTNWTFGNHTLTDFLDEKCAADRDCDGKNHMSYLKDPCFDYVVFQTGNLNTAQGIQDNAKRLMEVFRQANPNVKFFYTIHHTLHINGKHELLSATKNVADLGITVVDWGKIVYDLIMGNVKVEGGTQEYTKNTFIISKSAKDGYHPSMLSGYLTTQMLYCAMTGESAVGQDYSFCGNPEVNEEFDFDKFVATYYKYDGATTNFPAIFASKTDMLGLQKLIDKYLAEKPYLQY